MTAGAVEGLSEEESDAIRAHMEESLRLSAAGRAPDNMKFGRQMWAQCEALTAGEMSFMV